MPHLRVFICYALISKYNIKVPQTNIILSGNSWYLLMDHKRNSEVVGNINFLYCGDDMLLFFMLNEYNDSFMSNPHNLAFICDQSF